MKYIIKMGVFGVINYIARFAVGGILFMGVGMNPMGFWYGFLLTLAALIAAFIFLRFDMRPQTISQAFSIAAAWVIIALVLDMITAGPIVHITLQDMFGELQTWTRLIAILVVAPFAVRPQVSRAAL